MNSIYQEQDTAASDSDSLKSENPTQGKGRQPKQLQSARRATTVENNAVVKNLGNSTSLRLAINAMCFQCMGCTTDHYEPGTREEIRDCSAIHCSLWCFRPYRAITDQEGGL